MASCIGPATSQCAVSGPTVSSAIERTAAVDAVAVEVQFGMVDAEQFQHCGVEVSPSERCSRDSTSHTDGSSRAIDLNSRITAC
jgi:hypothetical protein